jgi:restriction system protein
MSARRAPRRRTRRRRSKKQQEQQLLLLLGAAAGLLALALAVVQWLLTHRVVLIVLSTLAVLAVYTWWTTRTERAKWERVAAQRLRYLLPQLDALHHRQFEHAIRDLMLRDGCSDALQVGGAGDNGADVKATDPFGRRWVIQCKHRRGGPVGSPVGTPDLHVLNGTARQLHGADVVVLVTNGRFSAPCAPLAKSQKLHLVDRHVLSEWAGGSRPLWELLQRLPPPRKPSALS